MSIQAAVHRAVRSTVAATLGKQSKGSASGGPGPVPIPSELLALYDLTEASSTAEAQGSHPSLVLNPGGGDTWGDLTPAAAPGSYSLGEAGENGLNHVICSNAGWTIPTGPVGEQVVDLYLVFRAIAHPYIMYCQDNGTYAGVADPGSGSPGYATVPFSGYRINGSELANSALRSAIAAAMGTANARIALLRGLTLKIGSGGVVGVLHYTQNARFYFNGHCYLVAVAPAGLGETAILAYLAARTGLTA